MSASKTPTQDDPAVREEGDFKDGPDGDAAMADGGERVEGEREEGECSSSSATTAARGRSASEIAKHDGEGGRTPEEAFLSGLYPITTPATSSAMLSWQPGDASSSGQAASDAGQGEQPFMRPLPILAVGEEKKREQATYVPPPKRRASAYLDDLERQNPTKLARTEIILDYGQAQDAPAHIKPEPEDEAMATLDYDRSPTPSPPPGTRARDGQDSATVLSRAPSSAMNMDKIIRGCIPPTNGRRKTRSNRAATIQGLQDKIDHYVSSSGPYETFNLLVAVAQEFTIGKKEWKQINDIQMKLDNLRRERVQKELSLDHHANRVQGGQQASSLPVRGPIHAMAPPLMVLTLPRLGMSPQGFDLAGTIIDEANHLLRYYSDVQLALSFQDTRDH